LEGRPSRLGDPTVINGVGVTHLRYPVRTTTGSAASATAG
jgi:hypothetical protein